MAKFSEEEALQGVCVGWFRSTYPDLCIFSVPNNPRSAITGASQKRTGMLKGVSDLVVMLPYGNTVFVEMKRPSRKIINIKTGKLVKRAGGKQSREQILFQDKCMRTGHHYYLIDSYNSFVDLIKNLVDNAK